MPSTVVPSVSTAVFLDGTASRRHYVHVARRDQPTVRVARESDLAAVLELWAEARSVHARTPDTREVVERLLTRDPGSLLLAELEGRIVGALIAAWDGWRGNMYRLTVREGHRRKGIGIALTRAGEEYLRQCEVRRVTALVAFDDDVAGAFWESAGYPADHEIGRRVRNL
jgi:ribosomal protein S18 acetylase RimI-like enzyme